MTQQELATAVGVSKNMIGRYEAGNAAPYVNVFGRIASHLGMGEVSVNGYKFYVSQPTQAAVAPEQLKLDLDKEHVYTGAEIRITPTKLTLTITAVAPEPKYSTSNSNLEKQAS